MNPPWFMIAFKYERMGRYIHYLHASLGQFAELAEFVR